MRADPPGGTSSVADREASLVLLRTYLQGKGSGWVISGIDLYRGFFLTGGVGEPMIECYER